MSKLGGCVVLAIALAGCTRTPPPNVLIVTLDTTRYDRFGYSGDEEAKTPVTDALARRGVAFDQAFASTPLTLPSHTSILTGLEPFEHRVRNNGNFKVPEGLDTLAERLTSAGYDTAAFVSAMVLHSRYGLNQGFATYDDQISAARKVLDFTIPRRHGTETTEAALGWLRARPADRPFFLWVHYFDAHMPHELKPPYDSVADGYAAALSYQDEELGRLLDGVAGAEGKRGTIVVLTADHGESLGEHGEKTHGTVAYDSTLHVPLIVAGPGVPAGRRSDAYVRHADIFPTVMDATGLASSTPLSGRSLVRLARKASDDETVVGYFENHGPHEDLGWSKIEGVRNARWKYTALPEPAELYDVRADPEEALNLIESSPEAREQMESLWHDLPRVQEAESEEARLDEVTAEAREQLASLGYVQARREFAAGDAPDPRKFVSVHDWVEAAAFLASAGRYAEALERLETLARSPSVEVLVLRTLAPVYSLLGRLEDSIGAYRRYAELTGAEDAHLGLAQTLLRAKRPEEALAELERLDARSWKVATERAAVLVRLGRGAEARAAIDLAFAAPELQRERLTRRSALVMERPPDADGERELRSLLAEAPDDPLLKSRLGTYLVRLGRREHGDEALVLLRSAAASSPDDFELLASLGSAEFELGYDEQAIATLQNALRIGGRRPGDLYRIALPMLRRGDREGALTSLREALDREPGARWAKNARRLVAKIERAVQAEAKKSSHASPTQKANRKS